MITSDNRLSFRPYRLAVERVQTQFDMIRFALKSMDEKAQKNFFQGVSEKQIASIEQFRLLAREQKLMPDEQLDQMADDQIRRIKSEARREKRAGNRLVSSEFSEDRLNQSELLLLVAHFESFMKLVHERFLLAAPNKVFGNAFRGEQNPRIPLKEN